MAVRRTRQISLKQCYEILNLQKGADLAAVKAAYRRRAFELHPDLHPDDPEASRQFQILNEAYVALSNMLKPQEEARQKEAQASQKKEATNSARTESATSSENTKTNSEESRTKASEKEASRASAAYAEQDVLRDLLNDPFARRVFEDIYSELNRKEEKKEQPTQSTSAGQEKTAKKSGAANTVKKSKPFRLWERGQEKGVKGAVKDWLRKQIDEEQSLTLPAARLAPGRKIRLQIRQGLSDELKAVEITLPPDFVIGKPVRLRGLGKRVGPWQGDLYLIINTE